MNKLAEIHKKIIWIIATILLILFALFIDRTRIVRTNNSDISYDIVKQG